MDLRTTIAAAVVAFGVSAAASQLDLRSRAPAPPVAAPTVPAPAITADATYAALLDDLDRRIDGLQRRAGARPGDWLIRMHLAATSLERAGLTGLVDDYERVQAVLDDAFAIAPQGSGPLLVAARFNFAVHRLDAAERHLDAIDRRAVPRADEQAAARLLRAQIAMQRGQYDRALADLTVAASASPATAGPELALYHAKTGDPQQAAALLEQALAAADLKDPQRRAWLRLQLAILAMDRGEQRDALQHLQRADAELSGWWLVQEHIAEIYNRREQHAAAIEIYERLVPATDLPQHMDALAGLYRHTGRPREADELVARAAARWQHYLARLPEAAIGHALQHYLQFGPPEHALELALADAAARPGGDAQVALARAYLQVGRPADALAVAEKLLASPYRSARLHDVAAKAHAALGHAAEAERQVELCLAINPRYTADDHAH